MSEPPHVRFTRDDIALFARASRDYSPVHVSDEATRRTPFGQPVVHGVLGGLAALAGLPPLDQGRRLVKVSMVFNEVLLPDIAYRRTATADENGVAASLTAGPRAALVVRGTWGDAPGNEAWPDGAAWPDGPAWRGGAA